MMFRWFVRLALLLCATAAPAGATPVLFTLPVSMTAGAALGAPALLTLTLDSAGGALVVSGPQDQASLLLPGAAPVTVMAYVPDGSASPGGAVVTAGPGGITALALTYRYSARSPNGWSTALTFLLAGTSPAPLFGPGGAIDPGFFTGFLGQGSITGASSGLTATVPGGFVETSTALGFALGVPEPGSGPLLLAGLLGLLALAPFRKRPALATTGASPRGDRRHEPAPPARRPR
ncbi:MAG: hypothetical protein ACP5NP_04235 [Acetobacteraceae bacterium]